VIKTIASWAFAVALLWPAAGALAEGTGVAAPPPVRRAPAPKPVAVRPLPAPAPAPTPAKVSVPEPAAVTAPVVVRPPASIAVSAPAPLVDWRTLDPENTLILETDKGRVVIELRPEFAPMAVARIKRLARRGIYDNLQFHRVIDGFIAQTGNPDNRDGSKSLEPDLPAEFTFRLGADVPRAQLARPQGESEGFIGAQPYVAVDEIRMAMSPDRRVSAWGAFCAGVVAMGHDADPDSSNSEFFIMRSSTRSLDRNYSVVGRVIVGLDMVRALTAGDPPMQPSRMIKARIMADLPDAARPQVAVLNTLSPEFKALADQVRAVKGADFSICDVEAPVRMTAAPAKPEPAAKKRPLRGTARRAETDPAA
jgi:peptidylprolyl isomerase